MPRWRLPRRRNCLFILFMCVVSNLGLTAIRGHWRPRPHVFGVEPARYSSYTPIARSSPPSWSCLNDSSRIIPLSAINDDYCDCPDGSDEPGTSACRGGWFFCVNAGGNTGRRIPSYSVDDGLCEPECCDGSDEPFGLCPNTCGPWRGGPGHHHHHHHHHHDGPHRPPGFFQKDA